MSKQRNIRKAHRGKRRFSERMRAAGVRRWPWWWHYDAIYARMNPIEMDWSTLMQTLGFASDSGEQAAQGEA